MAIIGNKKGHAGEQMAVDFLLKNDYSILDTNVSFREGEIDIVAQKDGLTVFVEVKYRTSKTFGSPEESLTAQKKSRLWTAIFSFCEQHHISESDIRFDLIAIEQKNGRTEIRHYESVEI